jgi:hypothetical protein
MNSMAEELRWAKDRCKALESRLRHEERQSRLNVEQVVKMEETIRELKGLNTKRKLIDGVSPHSEAIKPYHVSDRGVNDKV